MSDSKDNMQNFSHSVESQNYNTTNFRLNQKTKKNEAVISFFTTLILVLIIVLPVRAYIAKPFIVKGSSMDPTFETWDYLIIDEATYNFIQKPKRGEVIVFRAPTLKKTYFIKRIIGLPGETVQIENGKVIIFNDKFKEGYALDEPYIAPNNKSFKNMTVKLDKDEYFVMGDNRAGSYDSRSWGPLKENKIVGRTLIRLYPFNLIKLFPGKYEYINNI